jgi:16S rRNA (cytosine1402-N4)-methyltransferase
LTKIDQNYQHTPVLLNEVLEYLNPRPGQNFVDATLGGGGYTRAILDKILPNGKLLAIDLDKDAIKNFKFLISNSKNQESITLHHGNFKDIDEILKSENFPKPDGIVADIGLSSYQLDQAGRGISFQKQEELDMRFNSHTPGLTAKEILNNYSETDLRKIFEDYGEEKFSRQIARKVYELRGKGQALNTTAQLYQLIQEALPKPYKHKADSSARRIFQALRIAVNDELNYLKEALPNAFEILKPGGRIAVISFHSLEDRIVKNFFRDQSHAGLATLITKKPIKPSDEELVENPRARSAQLRIIQKQ